MLRAALDALQERQRREAVMPPQVMTARAIALSSTYGVSSSEALAFVRTLCDIQSLPVWRGR
jgi:hypothetical protein